MTTALAAGRRRAPARAAGRDDARHRAPRGGRRFDIRRMLLLGTCDVVVTACVLVVLYVLWNLFVADALIRNEQARAAEELRAAWSDASAAHPVGAGVQRQDPAIAPPEPGEAFAVLHVPRFGDSWQRPVVEGTTLADLADGAGHYRDSALPGQIGNFAVAGHRLTHGSIFKRIDALREGDPIVVETAGGWHVYRVTRSLIVTPDRVDVVAPVPARPGQAPERAVLTLTSCDPLFGSTHRFIVHAELERSQARAAGPPAEL